MVRMFHAVAPRSTASITFSASTSSPLTTITKPRVRSDMRVEGSRTRDVRVGGVKIADCERASSRSSSPMTRSRLPSSRPRSRRCSLRSRTSPATSRCLRDDLRPNPMLMALPQGGLNEEQQATARALALAALTRFRDDGGRAGAAALGRRPRTDHGVRRRRIRHGRVRAVARGRACAARRRSTRTRLAQGRHRSRHRRSASSSSAPGMSGLLAAHRLQTAGVDFVVLEKNDEVGGTWYENSYPGCRVDNPNHNYSYSFAQRHDWPFHFSSQDVLLDYFRRCANDFGLRDHIRFGTEVLSATWSEAEQHWTVRVRARGRQRGVDRSERGDQRGRPAESSVVSSDQRVATRSPARRSTRRGGTTPSTCAASASR